MVAALNLRKPFSGEVGEFLVWQVWLEGSPGTSNQRGIGRPVRGLLFGNLPELPNLSIHERGMKIPIKQENSILYIFKSVLKHRQFIALPNDIGNLHVTEHTSAIGQWSALHTHDIAFSPPQIEHETLILFDLFNAVRNIGA